MSGEEASKTDGLQPSPATPHVKLEIKPAYCIVDWTAVADQFPKGLAWLGEQLRPAGSALAAAATWTSTTSPATSTAAASSASR